MSQADLSAKYSIGSLAMLHVRYVVGDRIRDLKLDTTQSRKRDWRAADLPVVEEARWRLITESLNYTGLLHRLRTYHR